MWTGRNVPGGTTNDLYLQNINRNQKGTFYCTATNEVGSKTSSNVEVDVRCKLQLSLKFFLLSTHKKIKRKSTRTPTKTRWSIHVLAKSKLFLCLISLQDTHIVKSIKGDFSDGRK
jgi:hypothetical protein